MIDDRPQSGTVRAVEVGENRNMFGRIFRRRTIASEALLGDHQSRETRRGREQQLDKSTHGCNLEKRARRS
jgi:hypothetical protein